MKWPNLNVEGNKQGDGRRKEWDKETRVGVRKEMEVTGIVWVWKLNVEARRQMLLRLGACWWKEKACKRNQHFGENWK